MTRDGSHKKNASHEKEEKLTVVRVIDAEFAPLESSFFNSGAIDYCRNYLNIYHGNHFMCNTNKQSRTATPTAKYRNARQKKNPVPTCTLTYQTQLQSSYSTPQTPQPPPQPCPQSSSPLSSQPQPQPQPQTKKKRPRKKCDPVTQTPTLTQTQTQTPTLSGTPTTINDFVKRRRCTKIAKDIKDAKDAKDTTPVPFNDTHMQHTNTPPTLSNEQFAMSQVAVFEPSSIAADGITLEGLGDIQDGTLFDHALNRNVISTQ